LDDATRVVDEQLGARVGLRAAGFGFGGAIALALAARDQRVRGVACLGAPARLAEWAADPEALAERCRNAGLIGAGFPPDVPAWAAELAEFEPVTSATHLGGRSLLVVQGSADESVPPTAAGALVEAGGERAELRMVLGAGHWLRADPRATATLIGWLERQS
jgi:esterase/lipase